MPYVNPKALTLLKPTLVAGDDFTGFIANSFPVIKVSNTYPLRASEMPIAVNWQLPTNITAVSELEHLIVPHADDILLGCTRYFAYEQFLPDELAAPLKQHFYGPPHRYITNKYGMLCKTGEFRLNICTECVREDLQSERARVTWKRSHLLEGTMACPWHERPLFTFCDTCWKEAKKFYGSPRPEMWEPPKKCICEKSLVPTVRMKDRHLEIALGMAKMAEEVFARTVKDTVSAPNIHHVARKMLSPHTDRAGRRALLRKLMDSSFSREMLEHIGIHDTAIVHFVGEGKFSHNATPMKNIAVTYALFQGFDGFYDALNDTQPSNAATDSPRYLHILDTVKAKPRLPDLDRRNFLKMIDGLSRREFRAKEKKARSWFAETMKNHQGISRTALGRKYSRTEEFVFLKWVDNEWLTQQLENPAAVESARHRKAMTKPAYFKRQMKKNWTEAIKNNPMRKVTLNKLRLPMDVKAFNKLLAQHKHLKREASKFVETEAQWRKRVASIAVLKIKPLIPTHPLAKKSSYIGLTKKQFNRKIITATLWIKRNVNESVTPADFVGHRKRRKRID
ncbi:hypothetical protein Hrubri_4354 [Herbaspirillum rubrisubalbicans M1]|uniref:hypothetical protein n=1 Tax=Herbaspirillum rubrisubalbicans TaxID=80842 RepID=UPI00073A01E6|nr:hypothetical protein [Herbaspirillum rubrisubalbicans]ALU91499.1 hypothetical protein Hrubri_4354 [Herbaspirillum rubrisubalbicans M1]